MAKVPDLRNFSPDASDAKNVEDTPMLNTVARESVDMGEANKVGKELVNNDGISGPFGAVGRH